MHLLVAIRWQNIMVQFKKICLFNKNSFTLDLVYYNYCNEYAHNYNKKNNMFVVSLVFLKQDK